MSLSCNTYSTGLLTWCWLECRDYRKPGSHYVQTRSMLQWHTALRGKKANNKDPSVHQHTIKTQEGRHAFIHFKAIDPRTISFQSFSSLVSLSLMTSEGPEQQRRKLFGGGDQTSTHLGLKTYARSKLKCDDVRWLWVPFDGILCNRICIDYYWVSYTVI